MSEYKDEIIEDHEYDGIQEYDNPMPAWWTNLFLLSVVFAAFYVAAHGWGYIHSYGTDLRVGMKELETQRRAFEAKQPPLKVTDDVLLAAMGDEASLKGGAKAYKSYCASCHGDAGQGGIGPNLTDIYWIHGGEPQKVFATIKNGTANGMPAWSSTLRPVEMVQIVGFIHKLQQSKPAGAKPPQGKKFKTGMGIKPDMIKAAKAKVDAQKATEKKGS